MAQPMQSPLKRRLLRVAAQQPQLFRAFKRTIVRTMRDGYIHAGNIAYLSLVTLLPLAILITATTTAFGRTDAGAYAIQSLLDALPSNVAPMFENVINEVLQARSGYLLWAGGAVALWTVTTFIETLRDMHSRAYETTPSRPLLQRRLASMIGTVIAILLVAVLFVLQLFLVLVWQTVQHLLPFIEKVPVWIDLPGLLTPIMIFVVLWGLMKILTPRSYRSLKTWPGAMVTTGVWVAFTYALGPILNSFMDMGLTYGALSGVMVSLLFFYVVGMALVVGIELNAALAHLEKPH